ncbi:MAG: 16S rRNA (cytidine(1402)-2'-O)-methyltransferase [Anaerolineae bacterium]|nr:16S rRNA (cytidine(1402)-2'-O)-methyltransferase [Anaerolineae bacterium]
MPPLYVVPTPIGNLEDITLRALRLLREVTLIAAEDTRTTRVLLQHYQITTPLTSYHEHNKLARLDAIFRALENGDVALVSDAGTPGVSDPGYELVAEAITRGIRVEVLPGANAILPALVGSGLPTDRFTFLGFLPRREKALREFIESVRAERGTLIAYESPNRLVETLETLRALLGDRRVCVARELSKKFETFERGTLGEIIARFREQLPRGEITLVIAGAAEDAPAEWDAERVRAALHERLAAGEPLSSAARAVAAESGWNRRDVYDLGIGNE